MWFFFSDFYAYFPILLPHLISASKVLISCCFFFLKLSKLMTVFCQFFNLSHTEQFNRGTRNYFADLHKGIQLCFSKHRKNFCQQGRSDKIVDSGPNVAAVGSGATATILLCKLSRGTLCSWASAWNKRYLMIANTLTKLEFGHTEQSPSELVWVTEHDCRQGYAHDHIPKKKISQH